MRTELHEVLGIESSQTCESTQARWRERRVAHLSNLLSVSHTRPGPRRDIHCASERKPESHGMRRLSDKTVDTQRQMRISMIGRFVALYPEVSVRLRLGSGPEDRRSVCADLSESVRPRLVRAGMDEACIRAEIEVRTTSHAVATHWSANHNVRVRLLTISRDCVLRTSSADAGEASRSYFCRRSVTDGGPPDVC